MDTPAVSRISFVVFLMCFVLICFQENLICEGQDLETEFSGRVVTDMAVNLPVDELWAVFRSPDLLKLLGRLDPDFYRSVTYVSGNGEVGTIVNITLQPQVGGGYWYDEVTKIDDATKTRELTHRQGNFRNAGFFFFQSVYNIIENGVESSIIRITFNFEIEQQSRSNISQVPTFWVPHMTIANYINSGRSTPVALLEKFSGEIVSDTKVNLRANEVWAVYRSNGFSLLLGTLMPTFLKQVEYLSGDGGLNTVANITLQPEVGGINWIEKLIVMDDTKMTRLVRQLKGGNLDLGHIIHDSSFTIMEDSDNSCVIRVLASFKTKAESLANATSLRPNWDFTIAVANYINALRINRLDGIQ